MSQEVVCHTCQHARTLAEHTIQCTKCNHTRNLNTVRIVECPMYDQQDSQRIGSRVWLASLFGFAR